MIQTMVWYFRLSLFWIGTIFSFKLFGQHSAENKPCNCNEQLNFVTKYIEKNNAAFQILKMDEQRYSTYQFEKGKFQQESITLSETTTCLSLLQNYLKILKDHHTQIYQYTLVNKQTSTSSQDSLKATNKFECKLLNDSIVYLRISSFNKHLETSLNHFYDSLADLLKTKPYLVLDLRNNGGGSDACFHKLMPYIGPKKMKVDNCSVWVTEDNINLYLKLYYNNLRLLKKMRSAPLNTFVYINRGQTWIQSKLSNNPKKVFVLQNKGVASSAEDLILFAKQGQKVTTLGTPSGGYMGYGNVCYVNTPDNLFQLASTTTKTDHGLKFEYVGIPPDIYLEDFSNWEEKIINIISSN